MSEADEERNEGGETYSAACQRSPRSPSVSGGESDEECITAGSSMDEAYNDRMVRGHKHELALGNLMDLSSKQKGKR